MGPSLGLSLTCKMGRSHLPQEIGNICPAPVCRPCKGHGHLWMLWPACTEHCQPAGIIPGTEEKGSQAAAWVELRALLLCCLLRCIGSTSLGAVWKGQGFSSFDPTGNSYFFFELLVLLVRVGKPFSENIGRTWHLLWVFFVPHIETGPQFTLLTVS